MEQEKFSGTTTISSHEYKLLIISANILEEVRGKAKKRFIEYLFDNLSIKINSTLLSLDDKENIQYLKDYNIFSVKRNSKPIKNTLNRIIKFNKFSNKKITNFDELIDYIFEKNFSLLSKEEIYLILIERIQTLILIEEQKNEQN